MPGASHTPSGGGNPNNYNDHVGAYPDTWFRVCVIAVPVAGALILVLLVLTALRMLRNDSRRLLKRDESMGAKTQLYVADQFYSNAHTHNNNSPVLYTEHVAVTPCGMEKGYDHIGYMQRDYSQDGGLTQAQYVIQNEDKSCVHYETEVGYNHVRNSRNCEGMSTKSDYCICAIPHEQTQTRSKCESPVFNNTQRASLYKVVTLEPGSCRSCGSNIKASWDNATHTYNLGPEFDVFCKSCALIMWRLGLEGVRYSVSERGASHTNLNSATIVTQKNQCSQLDIHSKSSSQQSATNYSISHLHDESASSQESCDQTDISSRDALNISRDQIDKSHDETRDLNPSLNKADNTEDFRNHCEAATEEEQATCHEKLLPNAEP